MIGDVWSMQVCDTVAELGAELANEEAPGATQWPELLPFMFQCVQSGQPNLMESGEWLWPTPFKPLRVQPGSPTPGDCVEKGCVWGAGHRV